MKVWQMYFTNADHIYGIGYKNFQKVSQQECNSTAATSIKQRSNSTCTIYLGDQSDAEFLQRFITETHGGFDIIIDDGSHVPKHQIISFENLWPSVKPGGLYAIEDIETSFWSNKSTVYGYRLYNQTNVVKYFKGVIDAVNREFKRGHSDLTDKKPEIYSDISSIQFGQNIIIIRKALPREKKMLSRAYRFQNHKL